MVPKCSYSETDDAPPNAREDTKLTLDALKVTLLYFNRRFYSPAQLVKSVAFTDLLDTPWSQLPPPPPGTCLHFYRASGSSLPLFIFFMLVDFHQKFVVSWHIVRGQKGRREVTSAFQQMTVDTCSWR